MEDQRVMGPHGGPVRVDATFVLFNSVPTFDGLGYDEFRRRLSDWLTVQRLWGIVNGTVPRPPDAPAEATAAERRQNRESQQLWIESDETARALISLKLGANVIELVYGLESSHEVLERLDATFLSKSTPRLLALKRELLKFMIDESKPIADQLTDFRMKVRLLRESTAEERAWLSDRQLAQILISSIPTTWSTILSILNTKTEAELTVDFVTRMIILEGQRLEATRASVPNAENHYANGRNAGHRRKPPIDLRERRPTTHHNQSGFRGTRKPWNKDNLPNNSFQPSHQTERKPGNCNYCGKPGHWARECRSRLAKERNNRSNLSQHQSSNNYADTQGHDKASRRHCNYNQEDPPIVLLTVTEPEVSADFKHQLEVSSTFEENATPKENGLCFNSDTDDTWVIDSGSSRHICPDITRFTSYTKTTAASTQTTVTVGNSTTAKSHGYGDIELRVKRQNSTVTITLTKVLHVPAFKRNILSVSQATDSAKLQFKMNARSCIIEGMNGSKIAEGFKRGGLYYLMEEPNYLSAKVLATESKNSAAAILWHQRLGHSHIENLRKMQKKGLVRSDSFLKADFTGEQDLCIGCMQGKFSRTSFPGISESRTTTILELVHTDLCGPMDISSLGGSRFFLTFIDDYSRYTYVYFLLFKSDVTAKTKQYISEVERRTGYKVKTLRSDNGSEYQSSELQSFLSEKGIRHEKSAPYTPQQNGVAERFNRTILDTARSLLHHHNLPKKLWTEAVLTAVYLNNRRATTSLSDTTPYELFVGRKPSIDHLKIFGSTVWTFIHDAYRRKLDPKGMKGIFVGYQPLSKAYRVYIPDKDTIYVSSDCRFEEEVGEFTESSPSGPWPQEDDVPSHDQPVPATENNIQPQPLREHWDSTPPVPAPSTENGTLPTAPVSVPELNPQPAHQYEQHQQSEFTLRDRLRRLVLQQQHSQQGRTQRQSDTGNSPVSNPRLPTTEGVDHESATSAPNDRQRNPHWTRSRSRAEALQEETLLASTEIPEPENFYDAMSGVHRQQWWKAFNEEIESHATNGTWELVPRVIGRKTVKNKWVCRVKYDAGGNVERFKARLVAKGFTQVKGVDYEETYSPVTKFTSVRVIIAIAAARHQHLHHMDVKTAFLNGELDVEIYMEQPEGFIDKRFPDHVCRLRKGLYGLKQASRIWYFRLDKALIKRGFRRIESDHSIYILQRGKEEIYLAVYVDDLLLTAASIRTLEEIKRSLEEEFRMTDLGPAQKYLGLQIGRLHGGITISLETQICKIMQKFSIPAGSFISTPLDANLMWRNSEEFTEEELQEAESFPYRQLLGSLMFVMNGGRPDIAFSMSYLSRHCESFGPAEVKQLQRTARYLYHTRDFKLFFPMDAKLNLYGYCDADLAGDRHTGKSTSALVFTLGSTAISWKSKLQPIVALSTAESELISLTEACKEALWLCTLLNELGLPNEELQCTIFCDNQAALHLVRNPMYHSRTKHINLRFFFVREVAESGQIRFKHLPTGKMVADGLTKAACCEVQSKCARLMGLRRPDDVDTVDEIAQDDEVVRRARRAEEEEETSGIAEKSSARNQWRSAE